MADSSSSDLPWETYASKVFAEKRTATEFEATARELLEPLCVTMRKIAAAMTTPERGFHVLPTDCSALPFDDGLCFGFDLKQIDFDRKYKGSSESLPLFSFDICSLDNGEYISRAGKSKQNLGTVLSKEVLAPYFPLIIKIALRTFVRKGLLTKEMIARNALQQTAQPT